ncbi:hypothetical protein [Corallococcus aberystwythensis]|uniref:Uncharacterized protein n=1 Tax=Corallococcus aberystwythensis TaxID=2316722 RepID=A0A3A8QM87_9BACT|nr:hypothetical protein [Corallococcus aberystwythensis]RKH64294.1 hypothetical protein D7W81_18840 [Corallococcus aberystwythensis]
MPVCPTHNEFYILGSTCPVCGRGLSPTSPPPFKQDAPRAPITFADFVNLVDEQQEQSASAQDEKGEARDEKKAVQGHEAAVLDIDDEVLAELYTQLSQRPCRWHAVVSAVTDTVYKEDRRGCEVVRQAESVWGYLKKQNKVASEKKRRFFPPECVLFFGDANSGRKIKNSRFALGGNDHLWIVAHGSTQILGAHGQKEHPEDRTADQLAEVIIRDVPNDIGFIHIMSCNSGYNPTREEKRKKSFAQMVALHLWAAGFRNTIVYGYVGYTAEYKGKPVVTMVNGATGMSDKWDAEQARVGCLGPHGKRMEKPRAKGLNPSNVN